MYHILIFIKLKCYGWKQQLNYIINFQEFHILTRFYPYFRFVEGIIVICDNSCYLLQQTTLTIGRSSKMVKPFIFLHKKSKNFIFCKKVHLNLFLLKVIDHSLTLWVKWNRSVHFIWKSDIKWKCCSQKCWSPSYVQNSIG